MRGHMNIHICTFLEYLIKNFTCFLLGSHAANVQDNAQAEANKVLSGEKMQWLRQTIDTVQGNVQVRAKITAAEVHSITCLFTYP
jgi:hypothetical protein